MKRIRDFMAGVTDSGVSTTMTTTTGIATDASDQHANGTVSVTDAPHRRVLPTFYKAEKYYRPVHKTSLSYPPPRDTGSIHRQQQQQRNGGDADEDEEEPTVPPPVPTHVHLLKSAAREHEISFYLPLVDMWGQNLLPRAQSVASHVGSGVQEDSRQTEEDNSSMHVVPDDATVMSAVWCLLKHFSRFTHRTTGEVHLPKSSKSNLSTPIARSKSTDDLSSSSPMYDFDDDARAADFLLNKKNKKPSPLRHVADDVAPPGYIEAITYDAFCRAREALRVVLRRRFPASADQQRHKLEEEHACENHQPSSVQSYVGNPSVVADLITGNRKINDGDQDDDPETNLCYNVRQSSSMFYIFCQFLPKMDAALWLSCPRLPVSGAVDVETLYSALVREISIFKALAELTMRDEDDDGYLTEEEFEAYVCDLYPQIDSLCQQYYYVASPLPSELSPSAVTPTKMVSPEDGSVKFQYQNPNYLPETLLPFYACAVTRRILWATSSHLRSHRSVAEIAAASDQQSLVASPKLHINSVIQSKEMNHWIQVQLSKASPLQNANYSSLKSNWYSGGVVMSLYTKFLELDSRERGMLTRQDFLRYKKGIPPVVQDGLPPHVSPLTPLFLDRYFDVSPTFAGEMDFKGFVDFTLNVEFLCATSAAPGNVAAAASAVSNTKARCDVAGNSYTVPVAQYSYNTLTSGCRQPHIFFDIFDLDGDGFLRPMEINLFFREVYSLLNSVGFEATSIETVVTEFFELIHNSLPPSASPKTPKSPNGAQNQRDLNDDFLCISRRDFCRSPQNGVAASILIDALAFYTYESREESVSDKQDQLQMYRQNVRR